MIHKNAGQAFFDEQIKKISVYVNREHIMENVSWAALRAFGFIAWNDHRKENNNVVFDYISRGVHE